MVALSGQIVEPIPIRMTRHGIDSNLQQNHCTLTGCGQCSLRGVATEPPAYQLGRSSLPLRAAGAATGQHADHAPSWCAPIAGLLGPQRRFLLPSNRLTHMQLHIQAFQRLFKLKGCMRRAHRLTWQPCPGPQTLLFSRTAQTSHKMS